MEPRIQYAQTKDGVSIAFCTLGQGAPTVHMPLRPWSHIQAQWRLPVYREVLKSRARDRLQVRYDGRGTGLSDRNVTEFSLEADLLDMEAVVDRLNLERFVLTAASFSSPIAIAYAARHPQRVSRLVLTAAYARSVSSLPGALRSLKAASWELYTETVAHYAFGLGVEDAQRMAALMRECVTPETCGAIMDVNAQYDVMHLLPDIQAPTLVIHLSKIAIADIEASRELAARIPNARLAVLEATFAAVLDAEDSAGYWALIDEFQTEGEEATPSEPAEPGAFRTILFTDVEGSTALTQRLGDAKARELLREHERIVREALGSHGGSEIKTMGDGFMASFGSATRALECAISMQRAFAERASAHPEAPEGRAEPQPSAHGSRTSPRADRDAGTSSEPIRVRIGLNAGEPIAEEEDLFGTAVIAAARIAARADGGEILVSDVVRQLVAGKGFLFADRGEAALRGFDDPARLYEVRWRGEDEAD